ncbi:MAG: hypothetical protein ACI9JU_000624, partial [Pseudohongiellaceae bacterium]
MTDAADHRKTMEDGVVEWNFSDRIEDGATR